MVYFRLILASAVIGAISGFLVTSDLAGVIRGALVASGLVGTFFLLAFLSGYVLASIAAWLPKEMVKTERKIAELERRKAERNL